MTPAGRAGRAVTAPNEPNRGLLLTWPLRQVRDGIVVPLPGERDDDWAWEYEQDFRFGVGNLRDRRDQLQSVFDRIPREKEPTVTALANRLSEVKLAALKAYIDLNGRKARRVRDREAARVMKRARLALEHLIRLYRPGDSTIRSYRGVPFDPANPPSLTAPYEIALDALKRDSFLAPRPDMRNVSGNPNGRVIRDARRALLDVGLSAADRSVLLTAVGLISDADR